MRVLTVRQPWAWAIIHGGKDVENRSRSLGPYRGPVLMHAGREVDIEAFRAADRDGGPLHAALRRGAGMLRSKGWEAGTPPWRQWAGHLIGVVDLVDVHTSDDGGHDKLLRDKDGEVASFTGCSPWANPDAWHLVLANPRPLAEPIPYRGALGLRTLDEATTARVLEAIA